jgi:SNF2 family DNA or RNA helicase
VLDSPDLQRVLIGDEVGLGKTVEAGLIAQRLLLARPDLRVLYLAPARLVRNVVTEFRRLGVDARRWVAGGDSDARVEGDRVVVASIQKAVRETNAATLAAAGPWDLLIVDECHHLSDWEPGGGSPNAGYRLTRDLLQCQRPEAGHLLLLSGTPHQGHQARFENILGLLRQGDEGMDEVAGRVIFRTKESVRDWNGRPLFPSRDVRVPTVVHLGGPWSEWYEQVGALYDGAASAGQPGTRGRG